MFPLVFRCARPFRRKFAFAVAFGWAVVGIGLPAPLSAQTAPEPVIPYVAPRPANTVVMLPDGSTVRVELATTEKERQYGLMGRTKLPEGRGMLFVNDQASLQPYWMYHCKIGLDIVWMNGDHQIVEMSPDTPPCTGKADTCPNYGGKVPSQYVLELPVGDIARHKLAVGETIDFQLS